MQGYRFRRHQEGNAWHHCENCSQWPAADFVEVIAEQMPRAEEVCWECHGKEKQGTCQIPELDPTSADS